MRRFADEFSRLRLHTTGRLRTELEAATSVPQIINQLQEEKPDPKLINQRAGIFHQDMLSRASETALAIEREFDQQASRMIEATAKRLAKGFTVSHGESQIQTFQMAAISIPDTLHIQFGTYEKVQRGMMGFGVGAGLAGLLAAVFPPAAAIGTLLWLAAGFVGGKKGLEQLEEQKRAHVIGLLQQKLNETMMRASGQAQQHFAETAQQLEQFALNTFADAAKRARTDLQNRLQDVQAARKRNTQDAQLKKEELQLRLKRLTQLKQSLDNFTPKLKSSRK